MGLPSRAALAISACFRRDHGIDYGIEAGLGFAEARQHGDGDAPAQQIFGAGHGDEVVVHLHDGVGFVVDGGDLGGDFGIEEGAGGDLKGKAHHLGGDVDWLAGLPFIAHGCRVFDDGGGVCLDALAMEGWRGDAAMALVGFAVGGDEAFAEQDLHALLGALFDEELRLVDEDFADVAGVVEQDDVLPEKAIVRGAADICADIRRAGWGCRGRRICGRSRRAG